MHSRTLLGSKALHDSPTWKNPVPTRNQKMSSSGWSFCDKVLLEFCGCQLLEKEWQIIKGWISDVAVEPLSTLKHEKGQKLMNWQFHSIIILALPRSLPDGKQSFINLWNYCQPLLRLKLGQWWMYICRLITDIYLWQKSKQQSKGQH